MSWKNSDRPLIKEALKTAEPEKLEPKPDPSAERIARQEQTADEVLKILEES